MIIAIIDKKWGPLHTSIVPLSFFVVLILHSRCLMINFCGPKSKTMMILEGVRSIRQV